MGTDCQLALGADRHRGFLTRDHPGAARSDKDSPALDIGARGFDRGLLANHGGVRHLGVIL